MTATEAAEAAASALRMPTGWASGDDDGMTVPWGPLRTWVDPHQVDVVDARNTSLADLHRRYVAAGRPVVIRNALLATAAEPECQEAIARYVRECMHAMGAEEGQRRWSW